ncbi:MAG: MoaD/ThiS family protein [Firmicutes bacterium]|nr:MoaD/ThiS family protein [Bacillota bacterium]
MVRVVVRVVGHAREFFPGGRDRFDLELDRPARVADILTKLGVGRALVMTAIVGGRRRDLDHPLTDGDEVILMTPPSGG